MAYTDDWENLMNGVFGPGGKLRFDTQKTPPEKPGLPDMNAALLEQQKKLDEMLRKQNAELRRDTTQEALAQSRKMLEDMEADGLLAKGTTEVRQEHLGSFEGLAAEVKKTVLGQDAFVDGVVRAMRRPFVLGTEAPTARNVILLCGAPGTGRHFALTETAAAWPPGVFCRAISWPLWIWRFTPTRGPKSSFCRICTPPSMRRARSCSLSTTRAAIRAF